MEKKSIRKVKILKTTAIKSSLEFSGKFFPEESFGKEKDGRMQRPFATK